jgi:hypothetical protein
MAKRSKAINGVRRFAGRVLHFLKLVFQKIWAGIRFVWARPLIVIAVLVVLAVLLFNIVIRQTFKPYTNCAYLLENRLSMPSFFCDGYDVTVFGATIFSIPGLGGVMNPPLEFVRKVVSWSVVLFFAFLSLYLTILINNFKTIVRLVTLRKEEWKKLVGSLRTWLLLFVSFSFLFYFFVIR